MKYAVLTSILLAFCCKAYSNECIFQAKVHSPDKMEATKELYEETKELYNIACRFFIDTFGTKLDPKISLNNVYYVGDWKVLDILDINMPFPDTLHGLFYNSRDPKVNDLYINTSFLYSVSSLLRPEKVVEQSIVFHEIIHFLTKSAIFEYVLETKIDRNFLLEEALCYWSQNKYIEMATSGRKNMMDYVTSDTEGLVLSENFPSNLPSLITFSWEKTVYNSIHFFNGDTKEKYNKFVNNEYPMLFF